MRSWNSAALLARFRISSLGPSILAILRYYNRLIAMTEVAWRALNRFRRPLIVAIGTAGETACPTLLDQSFGEAGGAGGFACRWKLIPCRYVEKREWAAKALSQGWSARVPRSRWKRGARIPAACLVCRRRHSGWSEYMSTES